MAKTAKSKKAEAAGKQPATSPASVSEQSVAANEPTHEEIKQRAYSIYLLRGGADGHDLDDWLQAEREIREARSKS